MSTENQARILEEMNENAPPIFSKKCRPDDAVDVLGEMDEEKAQELFNLMEDEEKG
jgi:Mg/Co/Ni transporter MgtE